MIRANYETRPLFKPGQLVLHKRYGYRGVIVGLDLSCQASEQWYLSNQTQPAKNQPWYHVLVDGSGTVTYPAQTSLIADDSGEPISHPLIEHFFSGFVEGHYIRNSLPWPQDE